MRVFVTGASGWIGSAVVPELLAGRPPGRRPRPLRRRRRAGHRARRRRRRGDLDDPAGLAEAAADSDGVVHLGYSHDFSQMAEAAVLDRAAIAAMGAALEGSGRPLLFASGVLGLAVGRLATEDDAAGPGRPPPRWQRRWPRLALADRGVRPVAVRFAPTVHGAGDHGFIAVLVQVARERGVSAYVGDGANRWPAVHRSDAGRLVRLALESAPAGTAVHAVAEEGVATRAIAEAIGRGLGLPVESVPADRAAEHFGWIGGFFAADCPVSSDRTRERLGWEPTGPTLLEDLDAGHYTSGSSASHRSRTKVCLPLSFSTPAARSAMVTVASEARQASSAAYIARAMPHGRRHCCSPAGNGPFWRISVQRNAGSSPSMASTTSSTLMSAAGRVRV